MIKVNVNGTECMKSSKYVFYKAINVTIKGWGLFDFENLPKAIEALSIAYKK